MQPLRIKTAEFFFLRLGLSNLNRFNHNFEDCINPLCSCFLEIEFITHFLLHCHNFINTLILAIFQIIYWQNWFYLETQSYHCSKIHIINASVEYIINLKRLSCSLNCDKDISYLKQKGNKILQSPCICVIFHNVAGQSMALTLSRNSILQFYISYFGNNDLLLLQLRPGGNDSKNHSEHFSDSNKMRTISF